MTLDPHMLIGNDGVAMFSHPHLPFLRTIERILYFYKDSSDMHIYLYFYIGTSGCEAHVCATCLFKCTVLFLWLHGTCAGVSFEEGKQNNKTQNHVKTAHGSFAMKVYMKHAWGTMLFTWQLPQAWAKACIHAKNIENLLHAWKLYLSSDIVADAPGAMPKPWLENGKISIRVDVYETWHAHRCMMSMGNPMGKTMVDISLNVAVTSTNYERLSFQIICQATWSPMPQGHYQNHGWRINIWHACAGIWKTWYGHVVHGQSMGKTMVDISLNVAVTSTNFERLNFQMICQATWSPMSQGQYQNHGWRIKIWHVCARI